MRFRPEQHLRRQGDIRSVREQGRRVDCRAFTFLWMRRAAPAADPAVPVARSSALPPDAAARVCVVASTSAVGAAVQRNRAKRRLREVFRHHQTLVPAGCDVMLIARAAATHWPLVELEKRFIEACGRIDPTPSTETK